MDSIIKINLDKQQQQVHFQMTVDDFPPFATTEFTCQFFNCHFPSWTFNLDGSSFFSGCSAISLHALLYTEPSDCPAKSIMAKWISHSIFWSVWKSSSQPDQKIHFFPVLFSLLHVNDEMLAKPLYGYTLYNSSWFSLKTLRKQAFFVRNFSS